MANIIMASCSINILANRELDKGSEVDEENIEGKGTLF